MMSVASRAEVPKFRPFRWLSAVVLTTIIYFVVLLSGTYLTVGHASGTPASANHLVGAIWMVIAAYAACVAGSLIAPRENRKMAPGILAIVLIYWAIPDHFHELAEWVGFAGSVVAYVAAYLTVALLFSETESRKDTSVI